jgi:hypothetical protein
VLTKDILFGMNILNLAGFLVMGLSLTLHRTRSASVPVSIGLVRVDSSGIFRAVCRRLVKPFDELARVFRLHSDRNGPGGPFNLKGLGGSLPVPPWFSWVGRCRDAAADIASSRPGTPFLCSAGWRWRDCMGWGAMALAPAGM